MEFLKNTDLVLNAAGYLTIKKSGKPINHNEFVNQQRKAEYVVKLAAATAGKTFKCGKVDDLEAIKSAVLSAMLDTAKKYVDEPTKPKSKVNDELIQFALDFANYEDIKGEVSLVNEFMQLFNKIDDVEKVGDYFEEGVVKLNELYSIDTILKAVKATVAILD